MPINFPLIEQMVNDPRIPNDVIGHTLSAISDPEKVAVGNYIEDHHWNPNAENYHSWQEVLAGMHEAPLADVNNIHELLEFMVNDNVNDNLDWQEIQGLLEGAAQEAEAALHPGEGLPGGGEGLPGGGQDDGGGGPGIPVPDPGEPGGIPDLPIEHGGEGGRP
ncbi:hypothetical protein [Methylobacterium sp. J-090]|uniref:hypothetical protein n=1 Tax=Methylobacterium sp. J-090 TaxID=2836666 RepID=UPI001FBB2DB2|nr:hypothetical protein [Methylobacterium sp. J-090]MCJ2081365.1 hypothetical protein [Methylobacterium sp. J-090]